MVFRSNFFEFLPFIYAKTGKTGKKNTRKIRPIIMVETGRNRYIGVPLTCLCIKDLREFSPQK